MGLGNLFRRHRLKKYSSPVETGLLPLKDIRKAIVIIDAEDPSFAECERIVSENLRRNGIDAEIYYSDFRKFNRDIRPVTAAERTFRKKDSGVFGLPKMKKVRLFIGTEADMFISLSPSDLFIMEFIAKSVRTRFKAGRTVFTDEPFDLVIRPSGDDEPHAGQKQIFLKIMEFIAKVE